MTAALERSTVPRVVGAQKLGVELDDSPVFLQQIVKHLVEDGELDAGRPTEAAVYDHVAVGEHPVRTGPQRPAPDLEPDLAARGLAAATRNPGVLLLIPLGYE